MKKTFLFYFMHTVCCLGICLLVLSASAQLPTVTLLNPSSGQVGTDVVITGTNFNAITTNKVVFFGPTEVFVKTATLSSLTVTVPAGTNYQRVSVTNLTSGRTGFSKIPFTVTFQSGGSTNFRGINATPTGLSSSWIKAVGDLNGDGFPDMIASTAVNLSTQIAILLNDGYGHYPTKIMLPIGSTTNANLGTVADFDGDGKLDIAIVTVKNIFVLRSKTTIPNALAFDNYKQYAISSLDPRSLKAIDLDGDGKSEIVYTDYVDNTLCYLKNTSTQGY